jgi:hypothetical protein
VSYRKTKKNTKRSVVAAAAAVALLGTGTGVWAATHSSTSAPRSSYPSSLSSPGSGRCDGYGDDRPSGWGVMGDRNSGMDPGMARSRNGWMTPG